MCCSAGAGSRGEPRGEPLGRRCFPSTCRACFRPLTWRMGSCLFAEGEWLWGWERERCEGLFSELDCWGGAASRQFSWSRHPRWPRWCSEPGLRRGVRWACSARCWPFSCSVLGRCEGTLGGAVVAFSTPAGNCCCVLTRMWQYLCLGSGGVSPGQQRSVKVNSCSASGAFACRASLTPGWWNRKSERGLVRKGVGRLVGWLKRIPFRVRVSKQIRLWI